MANSEIMFQVCLYAGEICLELNDIGTLLMEAEAYICFDEKITYTDTQFNA